MSEHTKLSNIVARLRSLRPFIQDDRGRIRDLETHTALLESRISALERSLDARMWPLEHPAKAAP